jgi:hypothetical protein
MTMQRRPLNGMPSGLPTAIPTVPPALVLHTLDSTTAQQGGPFLNYVTLAVQNSGVAASIVTITTPIGTIVKSLNPGETWTPFIDQPMLSAGGQLKASCDVAGPVAYRSLGPQT